MARKLALAPHSLSEAVSEAFAARARKAAGRNGVSVVTIDFRHVHSAWERLAALFEAVAEARPERVRLVNAHVRELEWDGLDQDESEISVAHGDEIAAGFAAASGFARMTGFELSGSGLTGSGLATLLAAPVLGAIRRLDLNDNELRGESVRALLESDLGERLESLTLAGNPIGVDGVRWLASIPSAVTELDLARCGLREDSVQVLANSPVLVSTLRSLRLSENRLDEAAAMRLRQRYDDRVIL